VLDLVLAFMSHFLPKNASLVRAFYHTPFPPASIFEGSKIFKPGTTNVFMSFLLFFVSVLIYGLFLPAGAF
jgi:hypothetical protein